MKKRTHRFRKVFRPPDPTPDYYKRLSLCDVFEEVKKDISTGFYEWRIRAKHLEPLFPPPGWQNYLRFKGITGEETPENLTKALKLVVPKCRDLFESDLPGPRRLVAHFGKIINQALHSNNREEKKNAKQDLIDIISSRPEPEKWKKVYIPPPLSLSDMFDYLTRITIHLKKKYKEAHGRIRLDQQFKGLNETDFGLLEKKPKELTKELMANFFGLEIDSLKKHMEEEKRARRSPS